MKHTRTPLILLSILVVPGIVWAQETPVETPAAVVADEAAVTEEGAEAVDEGAAEGAAAAEAVTGEATEEVTEAATEAATEVAEPSASESPAVESVTTTDAPAEVAPVVPPPVVPAPESGATTTTTTSTAEPEPEEQTVPVDTTDWSYTPRNAEIDTPVDVSVSFNPSGWPTDSPSALRVEPTEIYPNYVRVHLSGAQQFSTGNELISVSSGRSMSMGTFGVGARIARHVSVDLNYVSGTTSDSVFADVDTTFRTSGGDARVRFDYAVFRFFRVYGAVGLGARSAHIEVNTYTDTVSQSRIGFAGSVAGGLELGYLGRRFGIGVFYEGGYTLQTPYNFDNARFEGSDNAGVDLGSIFLHGATHGGGLFVAAYF